MIELQIPQLTEFVWYFRRKVEQTLKKIIKYHPRIRRCMWRPYRWKYCFV